MRIGLNQLPNIISIFRIILVAPIVYVLLQEQYGLGLVLFAVAGASDGLDGFLAKQYNWESWLGSILDPIADKLLLVACFLTLWWLDLLPLWLVLMVFLRDVIIVTGATVYYFTIGRFTGEPTFISKFNTTMQIMLVLAVVLNQAYGIFPEFVLLVLIGIVALTTLSSGIDYVVEWGRRARSRGPH